MRKEDLVVLRYAQNSCYVELLEVSDIEKNVDLPNGRKYNFSVDPSAGIWNNDGESRKIGERINLYRHRCSLDIIGVFDRTSLKDLQTMVSSARGAVEDFD